ncbi:hypothetical protein V5O48_009179 [Marasmius crinis-equi]|uniref:F-box domain-containing protein n=1 Tax=Marasmius crinis-equi TaxID=585013 RepID=A0ABR3FBX1_9AGAR
MDLERPSSTSPADPPLPWIDILPNELLSYIFILTIPPAGATFQGGSISSQAVLLSHTSPRWRSVALDCPLIWATLTITPIGVGFQVYEEPLMLHVSRAQEVPLSLEVHLYTSPRQDVSPHKGLFTFIAEHARRIRHFELACLAATVWEETLDTMREFMLRDKEWIDAVTAEDQQSSSGLVLPMESLVFSLTAYGIDDLARMAKSIRGFSFPGLKTLSITYHEFGRTFTRDWALPWSQLTSLTFRCHDDADVPHILSSCPNLKSLSIALGDTIQYNERTPVWVTSRVETVLSELTELTLCIANDIPAYRAMTGLVNLLLCPAITSLSLTHEYESGISFYDREDHDGILVQNVVDSYLDGVVTFLSQRSKCIRTLTYLRIADMLVTARSLKRLLQTLTSLTEVEFVVHDDSDDEENDFSDVQSLDESFFLDEAPENSHLRGIRQFLKGECRMVDVRWE